MPQIQGTVEVFHLKPKFLVKIDGFTSAQFAKCSALEAEIEVAKYRQGGQMNETKLPVLVTFSDVTLERGSTKDKDFYNWFREAANAATGTGLVEPNFRRTVDIVQLDRDNKALQRWRLFRAFPQKFTAGEWDNNSAEVNMQMLTIAYEYFELFNA